MNPENDDGATVTKRVQSNIFTCLLRKARLTTVLKARFDFHTSEMCTWSVVFFSLHRLIGTYFPKRVVLLRTPWTVSRKQHHLVMFRLRTCVGYPWWVHVTPMQCLMRFSIILNGVISGANRQQRITKGQPTFLTLNGPQVLSCIAPKMYLRIHACTTPLYKLGEP